MNCRIRKRLEGSCLLPVRAVTLIIFSTVGLSGRRALSISLLLSASLRNDEQLKQEHLNYQVQEQIRTSDYRQPKQSITKKAEHLSRNIQGVGNDRHARRRARIAHRI